MLFIILNEVMYWIMNPTAINDGITISLLTYASVLMFLFAEVISAIMFIVKNLDNENLDNVKLSDILCFKAM